jgi:hypothetical protein
MTVAPATSQKRIEANRRNAQRSTGPRTPEGKSRSRFNGVKHGLTAKVPVIPGEDPAVYQARLDAMIESCAPQNQVELELLGRLAAATNWSLDRAARAEAAQISQRVRNYAIERERREEDEALALGQRLLWDARGPWQLYPHHPHTGSKSETRISWSQDPADANNPALLVLRLQRTVAGCRWLLDRWTELRARLEPGEVWAAPDQFKAIRLLGKQPLDAVDDSDVTLICLASAKLLPDGDDTKAFALVKHELHNGKEEPQIYSRELRKRPLAKLRPADAGAAREALRALVDRQTARLTLILARNQELAEADAAEAPDRLAFDPTPEGEKLRRYMLAAARLANQTIKQFLSVVRCPLSVETEDSGGGLENIGGDALALDWAYANPFAKRRATIGDASEAGATLLEREATISAGEVSPQDLRSEPNTPPAEPQLRPLNSPTSSSHDFPLALPGRGSDTMSGVTGSERSPDSPATPPLRSEPNNPPAIAQPPTSFNPEPLPHGGPAPQRTEPSTPPAMAQPPTSFDPEPLRNGGPAPLRSELNSPPAQPEPGPLNSRTSASRNSPLALAPPGRGPDTMSGVRDPDAPAITPLRSEPNTPPEEWQPLSSPTPEPVPGDGSESKLAQLNNCLAVLGSMYPPSALAKMTPSRRMAFDKFRAQLESMHSPTARSQAVPSERSEPNAAAENSQPSDSHAPHPPPDSAAVSDPTIESAADLGPFDVTDRRYFGAKMTTARAACEGSQAPSPPDRYRSISRKASKRRQQN